jgi:hypothetical protein
MALDVMQAGRIKANVDVVSLEVERQHGGMGAGRNRYFRAIQRLQGHHFPLPGELSAPHCGLSFSTPEVRATMTRFLQFQGAEVDYAEHDAEAQCRIARDFARGRELLGRFDPLLLQGIDQLVGCLFFARVDDPHFNGGASHGDALGVILMTPLPSWEPRDYAESYLHESIHQAVCVDDLVTGVFSADTEVLAEDRARSLSPVRSTYIQAHDPEIRRRYDMAFQAACVAIGLVSFYDWLGDADKANSFFDPLPESLIELRERAEFLTPHGVSQLAELELRADVRPRSVAR